LRVFNFAAGPATLPVEVLEQVREELTDWHGCGMSVMEVSHRSKAFVAAAQEAEQLLRELLAVPAHYKVLFLQGGATGQFAAIPMNIARADSTVDYLNTGAWSKKALLEARRLTGKVNIAADEAASNYTTVPAGEALRLSAQAAYVHYTPNETIGGVEFPYVPTPQACRWWPTCPRVFCRDRSRSRSSLSSTRVPRRTRSRGTGSGHCA